MYDDDVERGARVAFQVWCGVVLVDWMMVMATFWLMGDRALPVFMFIVYICICIYIENIWVENGRDGVKRGGGGSVCYGVLCEQTAAVYIFMFM